jgi:formate hydrogenlyase subunit 3/multisubunit Na+/H+ antiporter MnhD subunit
MALAAILLAVVALLLTAALAVPAGRSEWCGPATYGASLAISLVVLVAALSHLLAASPSIEFVAPLGLPWIGAHFRLDALAAFFLILVNLGGAAASLYAIGYGRHESEPQRVLPFSAAFLAGMNLVALADDAFTFLFSWEIMSLASWALVLAHHRDEENRRAAYIYLVMAGFSAFALLLAFGVLAGPEGGYAFAAMRAHAPSPLFAAVALGLTMLGAGSKAGLAPLHVWLPLAHPAAPSHVSALMSGAMTKVAVYAFIRIVFDLLGPAAWWWGVPAMIAGGLTAALGVLYALMQGDLKRTLAYSTIENIGIIFAALGLSLAFAASHMAAASALALTAALFHALNHTLFKSALFFGAGAVLTSTGARDMERLGGLIHRMPTTSVAFLVACAAISALPPINGFASEWLALQAILLSPDLPQWSLKLLAPAVGALIAVAAALAAACFVRIYGIAFLGRPRSPEASAAQEVDRWSLAAMIGLAALCVLAGILPGLVIDGIAPVAWSLTHGRMPEQSGIAWLSIVPIAESRSSYNGLLVFAFIAASAFIAAFAIHRLASRALRRGPAWDCGFPNSSPLTQYSAASFSQPIRRVFGGYAFAARERVDMPAPGELRPARFQLELHDLAWEHVYEPLAGAVGFAADRLNPLQFRTIRQYLSFVFFALVLLLVILALWG